MEEGGARSKGSAPSLSRGGEEPGGFHFYDGGGTGNAFASPCSRAHFSDYLVGNKSALSHGTDRADFNKKRKGKKTNGETEEKERRSLFICAA